MFVPIQIIHHRNDFKQLNCPTKKETIYHFTNYSKKLLYLKKILQTKLLKHKE